MTYITITILPIKLTRVLFEKDFIEGDQYKTQNLYIEMLQKLGWEYKDDFYVDLCYEKSVETEGK